MASWFLLSREEGNRPSECLIGSSYRKPAVDGYPEAGHYLDALLLVSVVWFLTCK